MMSFALIRLRKLIHALGSSNGRRALAHGVAASVEHFPAFGTLQFNTIVDVGANYGQFALFARKKFPTATIFSFEPLDDCWNTFDRIFQGDTLVHLLRFGIGPTDETVSMNVTRHNDSSSLLSPAATQVHEFGTAVIKTKNVQLRRLPSVLTKDQIVAPALLKIDVQGFELQVLRGSQDFLNQFEAVYIEASFLELYREQALAGDVIEFMRHNGFEIGGIFNQYVDRSRRPLQADFMFVRAARS